VVVAGDGTGQHVPNRQDLSELVATLEVVCGMGQPACLWAVDVLGKIRFISLCSGGSP